MAQTLYFSRDSIVHLQPAGSSDVYQIPVLDGFSFSQATNAAEITLNEAADSAGVSRRARELFNDSYEPASWSLQTYVRPFATSGTGTGNHSDAVGNIHAVEEAFWDAFVSSTVGGGLTSTNSDLSIDFSNSNKTVVGIFDLYFELGSGKANPTVYKIEGCVVEDITLDFDIDGIAMLSISGLGSIIEDNSGASPAMPPATIVEGTRGGDTSNYIRQKLTELAITASDTATYPGVSTNGVYNLVLTGGSISFANNITFLTPETLGVVNQPLGHVTGARSIGGSFTAYLDNETGSTADLFEDIINAKSDIKNSFDLTFSVGGSGAATRVDMNLPQAHLEVPQHSIDDVIAVEVTFHGLPSTISSTDEAAITYYGEIVTTS